MRLTKYILLTFIVLFVVSCSSDEGRVIPRGRLAEIYAEMLMTDQWILDTPDVRRMADTSFVYAPILERYGYTTLDYMKSVDRYMDDPERFSRILRSTGVLLDKKLAVLKEKKAELDHQRALEELLTQLKYESDFRAEEFFPYLFDEPYVHYYDSLAVEPDSVLMVYRFKDIDRADTVFRDLRMVVLDTLTVADSTEVKDTMALSDTIRVKQWEPKELQRDLSTRSRRKSL